MLRLLFILFTIWYLFPPLQSSTTLSFVKPSDEKKEGNMQIANPYLPQENDKFLKRDIVTLESKEIVVLESFPQQYKLVLKGHLPTVCHHLRVFETQSKGNRIDINVYSVVEPSSVCVMIVAPFEAKIDLNRYPVGFYSAWVNNKKIGDIEISSVPSMKGYELYSWQAEDRWCFSLLLGTNRLKDFAEITAPNSRLSDIDALKKE
ncbi:MAG: hypothetical protein JNN15_20475, partial [Blastocatellia bacterium]|nr:hypothetical protein [Blastocatellia bacterium]